MSTAPLPKGAIDTLIIVGGLGASDLTARRKIAETIKSAANRTNRIASICTGAFLLAEAGLLVGKRATTHWRYAAQLQKEYDQIRVEADRIFIRDGSVWTSAGITAGIDLALALIEHDLGITASRALAQELVVSYRRSGGQSQFSAMSAMQPESDRIRRALFFAQEHLSETLTVERLATVACISERHFTRAFYRETGETPAKAIERLRAEAARPRVEAGNEPIEKIATSVGFVDPQRMRRAFLRRFGQPPQAIRRIYQRSS